MRRKKERKEGEKRREEEGKGRGEKELAAKRQTEKARKERGRKGKGAAVGVKFLFRGCGQGVPEKRWWDQLVYTEDRVGEVEAF